MCVCALYQWMLQRLWTVQATKLYRPVFQNQPAWGWMWCGHVWACVHVLAYVCLHHVLFSKSLFTVWAGNGKMASSVAIRCMYCTCFSSDTSRPTECALQAGMRGIGPAHSSRACARSYQKWSKCRQKDCSWYPPPRCCRHHTLTAAVGYVCVCCSALQFLNCPLICAFVHICHHSPLLCCVKS